MTDDELDRFKARSSEIHRTDGYIEALMDFGIWKDGVQRIGCLETPVKEVIVRTVAERRLQEFYPRYFGEEK